jgi:hypothetical protein
MTIAFYLDVFVALLLMATIIYAVILNRKLGQLRADRASFEKMLKDFVSATSRAESGVALLQRTAQDSAAELDAKRDGAVSLRNDLEFLVARASEQADRLEAQISEGRTRERPRPQPEVTNIFDRLRAEDKQAKAKRDHDILAEPEAVDVFEDSAVTPAWLSEARKVAGAGEALR